MKFYITFLVITLFGMLTGCGGSTTLTNQPNANLNSAVANTVSPTNSNDTMVPVRTPEAATTNDAPTIAPIVAAYYSALRSKNEAGLRDVLSAANIARLEAQLKEEGRKDFLEFVAETETMTPAVVVRNEQITGDKASAQLKGGVYSNWTTMIFVKEGGKWKWSGDSPDTEALKAK